MEKIRTRFAPSPTGLLHVGNIRTALVAWLFARKHSGEFILRIDDTDLVRSTKEFEDQIKVDLSWLGLNWDDLVHQRDRLGRYEEIKKKLIKEEKLYPCFESPEELAVKRKSQLSRGLPPVYDRQALKLSTQQVAALEQEGKKPHFRFKLTEQPVAWNDLVQGELKFDTNSYSDPIVIREDGTWTYMLCSVIDDIDFNITHIIRGDDHISNTATQIQLFEACGAECPTFAHLPRISTKDAKISKRVGGFDIKSLREEKELEAMTINNFLTSIGTSGESSSFLTLQELTEVFDISKFHKSPTTYSEEDMVRINHKIISQMSFEQVKPSLMIQDVTEEFWLAVRNNLHKLSEIKLWYQVCFGTIAPAASPSDREFLLQAAQLLPDDLAWDKWIESIKANTTRKGKEIFMPLRLALTGVDHGPELKHLLTFMGRDKAIKRLTG